MSNLVDLWAETNPSLNTDDTTPSLTLSNATVGPSLKLVRLGAGAASVGMIQIQASGASVPILQLNANSFVSAVSIIFAASANWAGMGGDLATNPHYQDFIKTVPRSILRQAATSLGEDYQNTTTRPEKSSCFQFCFK